MRLKRIFLIVCLAVSVVLSGCSGNNSTQTDRTDEQNVKNSGMEEQKEAQTNKIDMSRWQYDEASDTFWQVGIVYCENPADESYENLGIYVPGAYMNGTENGDGTYTCEINASGVVGGYTAETAPVVIPVDTPGYSAMAAPEGYVSSTSPYMDAGFVYVYAGCRGRDAGAPAGVTDLKAAIRYIRYNSDVIPGSMERIFSFGMSGGGAQSALLGATGDSELYTPYLEEIGAVSGVSDAVAGSMCWCPITNLDYASEAYEWNLGVTRTGLSEEMQELSDAMAEQFARYINELGLTDPTGNSLILEASEDGIYQAGSYYDYLKSVIETSLNHFLSDTVFPYTVASGGKGGFGGFPDGDVGDRDGEKGGLPGSEGEFSGLEGEFPGPEGELLGPDKEFRGPEGERLGAGGIEERDEINRNEVSGGISLTGTYETVQDYIDALNAGKEWIIYDAASNTAAITSIADFVSALKLASKDLGAFDALDRSQGENVLFGYGDGMGAHFDAVMAELLTDNEEYGAMYAEDLARRDTLGTSVAERMNMYNPMYYISEYYDGYQTADVASHWRIRTGINQSDTALTTEVNLSLALERYGADVDFETVWGQGHVEAERTGNSTDNFIMWVIECCGQKG